MLRRLEGVATAWITKSEKRRLADEEHLGASESRLSEFGRQGRKILLTRLGDVFVSVCLRPNASEGEVQQHVLRAIQRAVGAL